MLPAATEIVAIIGQLPTFVGVSHECDYRSSAATLPRVTHCEIHESGLPSAQIDDGVRSSLADSGTLYTDDNVRIRELEPDVILTQRLCDVCAVGYGSVAALA